jgi:hypothetical protein
VTRLAIPKKLRFKLMYDSRYLCAVCQQRGSHIHHIDENHANNNEENLVVLCTTHHDEAHTRHQLSQNLTSDALRHAKQQWIAKVKEQRDLAATVSGQLVLAGNHELASMGVTWGYINHRRVGQLARPDLLSQKEKSYFEYCRAIGIVDQKGILVKPRAVPLSTDYIGNSIYDWYVHGDDLRLHLLYAAFVDQISRTIQPIHLEREGWTKVRIQELVGPGDFIFLDRGFYFRSVRETRQNQHRRVHTFQRKISVEFYVDTIDMFGTTSMTVSFSGHNHCAALLQLKSMGKNKKGWLVLHCTPIALGVGFGKNWSSPVLP